ncbi:MAG TPA: GIY-YIG nuclease family protein, partial [Nitrososphaerales archaeon]|nr:GIY-YIG nuclease family protein [Nitrososphaerales archaeon]
GSSKGSGKYWVYIVRCADGTLYAGTATDVDRRIREHSSGKGARYTRGRRPVTLVYSELAGSRSDALRREFRLKRLTRTRKEALISQSGRSKQS